MVDLAGPAWETFDGRVRQRIWRETDLFAAGNGFLKEKLELTTGRAIVIVDSKVWELYGPKMEAWAASVDLKLDAVVAPGNEDQKTMETFCFLLDELKRVDPLRRSEPVSGGEGGQRG
jgi:3-dehydroquinate synthetase